MNQTVAEALNRELAGLERVVPTPSGDLGYGRDLSCTTEVRPDLADVDPSSPAGIAEAAVRRLITPRGGLPDDPDYGFDVTSYCNRGVPASELRDLGGLVRNEITKDDRIAEAAVAVTVPSPGELRVEVRITPADPLVTPFSAVLAVANGAALVEAIG